MNELTSLFVESISQFVFTNSPEGTVSTNIKINKATCVLGPTITSSSVDVVVFVDDPRFTIRLNCNFDSSTVGLNVSTILISSDSVTTSRNLNCTNAPDITFFIDSNVNTSTWQFDENIVLPSIHLIVLINNVGVAISISRDLDSTMIFANLIPVLGLVSVLIDSLSTSNLVGSQNKDRTISTNSYFSSSTRKSLEGLASLSVDLTISVDDVFRTIDITSNISGSSSSSISPLVAFPTPVVVVLVGVSNMNHTIRSAVDILSSSTSINPFVIFELVDVRVCLDNPRLTVSGDSNLATSSDSSNLVPVARAFDVMIDSIVSANSPNITFRRNTNIISSETADLGPSFSISLVKISVDINNPEVLVAVTRNSDGFASPVIPTKVLLIPMLNVLVSINQPDITFSSDSDIRAFAGEKFPRVLGA
mmetsp:Transcript_16459/g.14150  ORF Transcript_16459/g.14150 Transcript_16459/m.14150 type:complete len:421 (-) Transcript_16459:3012-4274(-)